MKTLIFTDSHGKDPSKLVDWAVKLEGIEKLASLGDLDTPNVLQDILEKTKQHNLRRILAIGNHEYHYVKHYGMDRTSYMSQSASDYLAEWDGFPKERQFVLDAIEGKIPDTGLIVSDNEIVYAHASLADIGRVDSNVPDFVWGRLLYHLGKLSKSFDEMGNLNDFRLFFRGHDHLNAITVQKGNIIQETEFGYWGKRKIDIENTRTIVSVGAFYEGEFALYDNETQEVDFKCWNFTENKPY